MRLLDFLLPALLLAGPFASAEGAGRREATLDPLFMGEGKTYPKPTPDQEGFHQNYPLYGLDGRASEKRAPSPETPSRHAAPRAAAGAKAAPSAPSSRPSETPKPERPAAMEGLSRFFKAAKERAAASPSGARRPPAPTAEDLDAQYDHNTARDSTELLRPEGPSAPPRAAIEPMPSRSESDVFVAMDLDVAGNPGQYRDAVAQLSKTAGFSVDSRFSPAFKDGRRIAVWGWLPASKIGEAMRSPWVARLEAPRGSLGGSKSKARATIKVLLRLPAANGQRALASSLMRLSAAGFQWQRTIGFEPQSSYRGVRRLAVIGTAPVSRMNRLMADPSVLRVEPYRERLPL